MNLADLTFEVRDKWLTRLGVILPKDLDFEYTGTHNNVGTWTLSLRVEHPLAADLRSPGAGLIVSGLDGTEIMSGPTSKPEHAQTPEDVIGTLTVAGVTDTVALMDALAYPQPSNGNPTTQTKARDERAGSPEALMHQFVRANIGPDAPANRRKANLTMGVNLNRPAGVFISKGARFPVLGELLSEIATAHDLGFHVIQRGSELRFETYEVVDRSHLIRLDILNGSLDSQRVAVGPPGVTRVIVAGQNEGVDRQFIAADTAASVAAEALWGRRIERFVDQRQTDDIAELQQAADEVLAEEGLTEVTIQAIPTENSDMRYGYDWNLGDRVGVVSGEQELVSIVTGVVIKVDGEGVRVGALIGDPTGFNTNSLIRKRMAKTESRLSALERVEPPPSPVQEGSKSMTFSFPTASQNWPLPHNFHQRTVLITTYDNNGTPIVGDPIYVDDDNAQVAWFYPTAGSARVQT